MIKKSNSLDKTEDPSPVLEGELIDEEKIPGDKVVLSQRDKIPVAYTLGKIAGYLGTFIAGILKSRRMFFENDSESRPGSGKRGRRGRKQRRSIRRS